MILELISRLDLHPPSLATCSVLVSAVLTLMLLFSSLMCDIAKLYSVKAQHIYEEDHRSTQASDSSIQSILHKRRFSRHAVSKLINTIGLNDPIHRLTVLELYNEPTKFSRSVLIDRQIEGTTTLTSDQSL